MNGNGRLYPTYCPRYDRRLDHYKDLLREAEQERLDRRARQPVWRPWHLRPLLLELGRRLAMGSWRPEEHDGARA